MMKTRIKVCGLTRPEDVQCAVQAGVDAIGLVFCPPSPRHLAVADAAELARQIPAFVTVTALFMNPSEAEVREVLQSVQPELLQFHGAESAAFCEQFGRRYIKAIAMGEEADPQAQMQAHPQAAGFLLDSHALGGMGGSGEAFDWPRARELGARLIVAGGLNPDNVGLAIEQAQAWAVDVSSGVESAPGIKSASKIERFVENVRAADAARSLKNA